MAKVEYRGGKRRINHLNVRRRSAEAR